MFKKEHDTQSILFSMGSQRSQLLEKR